MINLGNRDWELDISYSKTRWGYLLKDAIKMESNPNLFSVFCVWHCADSRRIYTQLCSIVVNSNYESTCWVHCGTLATRVRCRSGPWWPGFHNTLNKYFRNSSFEKTIHINQNKIKVVLLKVCSGCTLSRVLPLFGFMCMVFQNKMFE